MCERGYGKRTALADYPTKNRGGKGVITIKTTTRNGLVAATRIVTDDDHLILISDRGKLIRMRVHDIPVQGRATQGVRVMRVDDGEHVAAIERLADPADESAIAEGAPVSVTLVPKLVEGALAALDRGDRAEHDRLMVQASSDLRDCDVIALAQYSMAPAAGLVAEATGRPVLTTPDSAVAKLKQMLG